MYKEGDKVVLSKNHTNYEHGYTFYAGMIVQVISMTDNGYTIVDGMGRVVANCGFEL